MGWDEFDVYDEMDEGGRRWHCTLDPTRYLTR
jgi:hypothetical protein